MQAVVRVSIVIAVLSTIVIAVPVTDVPNDSATMPSSEHNKRCPRIVSRSEWGAREPKNKNPLALSPAPYVVVHHGGINHYCKNETSCAQVVRSYQNLHMDKNKWWDIGYNFVIGEDGNVYEGRGWDTMGAHAPKYNNQSIGVSVIGDFTKVMPNEAALKALSSLIECGLSLNKIQADYHVLGHRQGRTTECPGETFYKYVQEMPHWTDQPTPFTVKRSLQD